MAATAGYHDLELVTFHAGFLRMKQKTQADKLLDRLREVADVFASSG